MIHAQDLLLVAFLAFLEAILSIDNAVVLAMMARPLPRELQRKALTYGLLGSVGFRLILLGLATKLMHWPWVRLGGGTYLLVVAFRHLAFPKREDHAPKPVGRRQFWRIVLLIELMDVAFAVDSILAAVALTPKFWIVFVGGMIGVLLMRMAASMMLKVLQRFPGFEKSGYLLVGTIGAKLMIDGLALPGVDFESTSNPAFLLFWSTMALWVLYGFKPGRKRR